MKISFSPIHDSREIKRILVDPITPINVGRAKAANQCREDNLFLLPKVISRQHATIYQKDDVIYIQDTKSSGGTWVNGARLSKAGVESSPMRLNDNDVIQFGEDTDLDGNILKAVCFKVNIFDSKSGNQKGESETVTKTTEIQKPRKSLLSPEFLITSNTEANASTLHALEKAQERSSIFPQFTQFMKPTDTDTQIPSLPKLPDVVQEELDRLWAPLDQIALPFRNAEILLSKKT